MGSSVQILLLEKHAGLHVATLKSLKTSKIRIPKSPKYKKKIRNKETLLPTILLRNKVRNSLIKQYRHHTHCIAINQTAVTHHVVQSSSNYLMRIKIKCTLTLDNILIKPVLTSNLSKIVVFRKTP